MGSCRYKEVHVWTVVVTGQVHVWTVVVEGRFMCGQL